MQTLINFCREQRNMVTNLNYSEEYVLGYNITMKALETRIRAAYKTLDAQIVKYAYNIKALTNKYLTNKYLNHPSKAKWSSELLKVLLDYYYIIPLTAPMHLSYTIADVADYATEKREQIKAGGLYNEYNTGVDKAAADLLRQLDKLKKLKRLNKSYIDVYDMLSELNCSERDILQDLQNSNIKYDKSCIPILLLDYYVISKSYDTKIIAVYLTSDFSSTSLPV